MSQQDDPRAVSLRGEDGSIVLALLAAIIGGGLMVVIVASVLAGQRSVRFDEEFTQALNVAEHGVEEAVHLLNTGLLQPADLDGSNQYSASGTADGVPYEYTIEWNGVRGWTVKSTGGDTDGVQRRLEVLVEERPRFHVAAFSDQLLAFGGGNTADSYNSKTAVWCTDKGRVGSNEDMNFPGGAQQSDCHKQAGENRTVDGVDLYDWDDNPGWPDDPGNERCTHDTGTPNNCKDADGNPRFDTHADPLELNLGDDDDPDPKPFSVAHMEQLIQRCKDDLEFIPELRASAAPWNGTIAPAGVGDGPELFPDDPDSPHYWCAGRVVFDVHTTLTDDASGENPVIIVVEHSIAVEKDNNAPKGGPSHPDVHCVNCTPGPGAGADAPEAAALQIYTPSEDNPDEQDGNVVKIRQQSIFAGTIWAPRGACGGLTGSAASVHIYGSLVCGNIRNVGGWQFHFDEALLDIGMSEFGIAVWTEQR